MINYIILILLLIQPTHDFHTSWMNITYDEGTKAFNSSWQTDTEHLESCLSVFSSKEIHLDDQITATQKKIIKDYLIENFSISIDGKKKDITIGSIEVNFAETFIHLNPIKHRKKISSIAIDNRLLIKQFPNQKNMVQINYEGSKYSILLNNHKTSDSILLNDK